MGIGNKLAGLGIALSSLMPLKTSAQYSETVSQECFAARVSLVGGKHSLSDFEENFGMFKGISFGFKRRFGENFDFDINLSFSEAYSSHANGHAFGIYPRLVFKSEFKDLGYFYFGAGPEYKEFLFDNLSFGQPTLSRTLGAAYSLGFEYDLKSSDLFGFFAEFQGDAFVGRDYLGGGEKIKSNEFRVGINYWPYRD